MTTDARPSRFSLPWEPSFAHWSAGQYTIMQEGWHDTGRTVGRWVLRYRGTVVHTGSGFGGDDVNECKLEADRHRGISKPGAGRPSTAQIPGQEQS